MAAKFLSSTCELQIKIIVILVYKNTVYKKWRSSINTYVYCCQLKSDERGHNVYRLSTKGSEVKFLSPYLHWWKSVHVRKHRMRWYSLKYRVLEKKIQDVTGIRNKQENLFLRRWNKLFLLVTGKNAQQNYCSIFNEHFSLKWKLFIYSRIFPKLSKLKLMNASVFIGMLR